MANMSYCRFQNTSKDLDDCKDAIEELFHGMPDANPLSDDELRAAQSLIATCYSLVEMVAEHVGMDLDELMELPNPEELLKRALANMNSDAEGL